MNSYAAVVQAIASVDLSWPGIKEHEPGQEPLGLARFLPDRIYRAFAFTDPSQMTAKNLGEVDVDLPEAEKAAFEKAKENAVNAATALIEVALTDPDGILGAYLKGLPPRNYEDGPWVSYWTPVEKLMTKRPEIFRAAAANEEANRALWEAGKGDLRRRNIRRMMEISLGILQYASEHGKTYPESLKVLFEKGYLKPPLEARSVVTGKPYVYVAAGEKQPAKGTDWDDFILLYDESVSQGCHQCAMADGSGRSMRVDIVKHLLKKQAK
jgi:hypothetical protein